jgi:type IV pilus assembly protein PilC
VVRVLIKKLALERFTSTFSSLLKSGMPIINSLEITANAVGNEEIKISLLRIARQGIAQGLTVGDAFKREPVFPRVVSNLIAISEKAGHLDEILKSLSEFYDLEIDRALKTLVSFLEPALFAVIGVVVALIALSIIVPIYQLVGQF